MAEQYRHARLQHYVKRSVHEPAESVVRDESRDR